MFGNGRPMQPRNTGRQASSTCTFHNNMSFFVGMLRATYIQQCCVGIFSLEYFSASFLILQRMLFNVVADHVYLVVVTECPMNFMFSTRRPGASKPPYIELSNNSSNNARHPHDPG
jgi:hypothetical protein